VIFLDTNVISEQMRPHPNPSVIQWLTRNDPQVALSTIVIGEITFGITRIRNDERSPRLAFNLASLRSRMSGRIHPFDDSSADIYGDIMGQSHLAGRTMSVLDGMIAAIALRHKAALATRNGRHFLDLGLTIIDPWTA
jgi:predicted nucleic acid-binding protein